MSPRSFKARPTTDFAKENLFNVLNGYLDFDEEPEALDLFAGTGSITIELLSRGCGKVVSVERDAQHFRFISQIVDTLKAPQLLPAACRRVPLFGPVQRTVRLYLCRSSVCLEESGRPSRPRVPAQPAETRRPVRAGAWQNQ